MKENNHRLFTYGSLRSGFHHPAYQYISRYFTFIANAKIKGHLCDMGPYPAAVPADDGRFIVGELYTVIKDDEFSWAIEQLDDYEGVVAEEDEGETPLFRREITTVYLDNGDTVTAWVYWFNGDITGRPVIESGDVMEYFKRQNKL